MSHSYYGHDCCSHGFRDDGCEQHHPHHEFAWLVPWCSFCNRPSVWCCCGVRQLPFHAPTEGKPESPATASATPTPAVVYIDKEILIQSDAERVEDQRWLGGTSAIRFSLEFMRQVNREVYEVSVDVQWPDGSLEVFSLNGPLEAGYQSPPLTQRAKPGMSVVVRALGVIARLRWVETLAL